MEPWQYKSAADTHLAPMQRLRSERREPGLVSVLLRRSCSALMRGYFRTWHRLRVEGAEHIPEKPPFVLIGNHSSHLDALVLAACLPGKVADAVYPIAAGDAFFESALRTALSATMINALPMWRKKVGRHALDDLKQRLRSGDCAYILFPEGARTRDGQPLKWKPGIGMMVANSPIPVIPCRLWGCFESLPAGTWLPRPRKIRVKIAPPVQFDQTPDTREGWEQVAQTLRDIVLGTH